jgi:polysaccharide pyruvyl transferase CsaB
MTTKSKSKAEPARNLILISGYYGFDNLGDEAILEEIVAELLQVASPEEIYVLSANPERTAEMFGVQALARNDLWLVLNLLKYTRLFISGGGGLFQNTRTVGSIMFYGLQIMMARLLGAKVMIYAQGLGPLRGGLAKALTKKAFGFADAITVRDAASQSLLGEWQIDAVKTADPVWCLNSRPLPESVDQQLRDISAARLIGLSLRPSHNFSDSHLRALALSLHQTMPSNFHLLLLALQNEQDHDILLKFGNVWQELGRASTLVRTAHIQYPSQWISLFGRCKLVVGMRLHALIMGMKAGVGVVGIAYDPKVHHLLTEFELPILNLTKEPQPIEWEQTLKAAFSDMDKLSRHAMRKAEGAKKLACQNFNLLDRILRMQSDS